MGSPLIILLDKSAAVGWAVVGDALRPSRGHELHRRDGGDADADQNVGPHRRLGSAEAERERRGDRPAAERDIGPFRPRAVATEGDGRAADDE